MNGSIHVTTWADGFGLWHAEVMTNVCEDHRQARVFAREAIRQEILARSNYLQTVAVHLVLVRDESPLFEFKEK